MNSPFDTILMHSYERSVKFFYLRFTGIVHIELYFLPLSCNVKIKLKKIKKSAVMCFSTARETKKGTYYFNF